MATRRSTRKRIPIVYENQGGFPDDSDTESSKAAPLKGTTLNTTQTQPGGAPALSQDGEENYEPPPLSPTGDDEDEEGSAYSGDDGDADATTAAPHRRRTAEKPSASTAKPPDQYLSLITGDAEFYSPYSGLLDKLYKGKTLLRQFYGPGAEGATMSAWADSWEDWGLLPVSGIIDYGIFHDEDKKKKQAESQSKSAWTKSGPSCFDSVPVHDRPKYGIEQDEITCFIGDYRNPDEVKLKPGQAVSCSQHGGIVSEEESSQDAPVSGWLLDAGGIILDVAWQPQQEKGSEAASNPQCIAVAVIPRQDHDIYDYDAEASKPDFEKHGTVQLWELNGQQTTSGPDTVLPHRSKLPVLKRTLCIDRGRARRVEWNPSGEFLAILSGYGEIIVVPPWEETASGENPDRESTWDFVNTPLATLALKNEPYNKATAIAWISRTQIAAGYTDGSICLWSIDPAALLVRHPTHHCDVVSLVTARPSHPTLLASYPIGGNTKLIDINCPDYETTEAYAPTIATQPHLLAYSPHLRGFFMTMVSSHPLNDIIVFAPSNNFAVQKRVFQGGALPSAISLGVTHPFILIGTMDGSLWALNQTHSLFSPKGTSAGRIRLLQHEHRPSRLTESASSSTTRLGPRKKRGGARIVMGFEPDKMPVLTLSKNQAKAPGRKASSKKKKKKKTGKAGADVDPEDDEDEDGGDGDSTGRGRGTAVVHEPETRVTAVEWNPNGVFGTWAAVSFGNGLLRVLDLGLQRE